MPNAYRKILAKKIDRLGGYSARWDTYPVEFDVSLWPANIDLEDCVERIISGTSGALEYCDIPKQYIGVVAKKVKIKDGIIFDQTVERLQFDLQDCDTFRFIRPEIENKYGIQQPKNGYSVTFALEGRGGKHLVIVEFENVELKGINTGTIIELLTTHGDCEPYGDISDPHFTNKWVLHFLAFLEECQIMFSRNSVKTQAEYAADLVVINEMNDIYEEMEKSKLEVAAYL